MPLSPLLRPSTPVLYSTNTFLKRHIYETFRKGTHFVWCSEYFDVAAHGTHSAAALIAPSSTPAKIYRDLHEACRASDRHNDKIEKQRGTLQNQAVKWRDAGDIDDDTLQEIFALIDTAAFNDWRPLLYVIPTDAVLDRVDLVPGAKRASIGREYWIDGLRSNEFDILEFNL